MLMGRMNGFDGPLALDLRASHWLRRALLCVHALICGALLLAYPSSWPRNLLILAVAAHLPWSLKAARVRSIVRLEFDAGHHSRVLFCDGRWLDARLTAAPWLSPHFTTLVLTTADGVRHPLVLLPDMVDGDAFRRLRVRVRRMSSAAD